MEDATDGDLTQLRTLVSTLGLARDAPITRLSSVSNIVCRIGDGAAAVVVRAANRQRHGADRREEARNATNAAGVGLAPAVLHAGIDDGTFVTRWIDGRALDPVSVRGDHGAIGAVAAALRRVHALPPGRHRFDPVEVVDAHLADLDPRHDLHRARAVRDGAASRIEPAELVVCHNDPWPGNVIIVAPGHRTRLEAEVLAVFNTVIVVFENAVEAFVQVRHVIAAVEIIIDKDFPVAVESVATALDPMKIAEMQLLKLID